MLTRRPAKVRAWLLALLCGTLLASCAGGAAQPTSPPAATPRSAQPTDAPVAATGGLTRVTIDGRADDWSPYRSSGDDPAGDQPAGSPDLGEMRAFSNDAFFYMYIAFHQPGDFDHFYFNVFTDDGGQYQLTLQGDGGARIENKANGEVEPVTAEFAWAEGFEFKIPRSAVGEAVINHIRSNVWLGSGTGDSAEVNGPPVVNESDAAPSAVAGPADDAPPSTVAGLTFDAEAVQAVVASHAGEALSAQSWTRLGGPPGGLGYDIRVNPENPNIWYVTDAFAGIHKSIDSGVTWFPINEGIDVRTGPSSDAIPVFSTTIDPNDPDIVWIGMIDHGGIYRSEDGGQTWEQRVNGVREQFGLTIRNIAIEPGNSDVVYASGEVSSWVWAGASRWGIGFDRVQGVIYRSTDAGRHWTDIWRGDNLVRYVLIDPTDVNTLYASTGIMDREAANSDPATRTPGGVGILKSTDGGQTWMPINHGLESLYVGSLAMHPQDPRTLLAAAGNFTYREGTGIYLTRDGGESWEKVIGSDRTGGTFMSVEFFPGPQEVWYASGGHTAFYVSRDEGKSWEEHASSSGGVWSPAGYRTALPIDVQPDPRDPDRIFVNNYGGGNYVSEDGGRSWASASIGYSGAESWAVAVHPQNPAIVYANGRSSLFVSLDGGLTWKGINALDRIQDGPAVAIDPSDPAHLLASEAQHGWIFESRDGGTSWEMVSDLHNLQQGVPTHLQSGVYTIAFAPSDPGRVYAGLGTWACLSDRSGRDCSGPTVLSLMVSEDGGTNWRHVRETPLDGLSVAGIVVHPEDDLTAWAATTQGVFFTADGGDTWEARSDGLPGKTIQGIALDPRDSQTLFAASAGRGMFLTNDGGMHWQQASQGMDPNEILSSVVVDPARPGVAYAGAPFSGVFVTEDGGATWRRLNDGLDVRAVTALAISAGGSTLYATTLGQGVYRLSLLAPEDFIRIAAKH